MRTKTDDYLETYQMLSSNKLGELKFYEMATYWEFDGDTENPYGDEYHVSDGKQWDKVYDREMNGTAWHEKTYKFHTVEYPAFLSGKKSKDFIDDPNTFTLMDIEKSKIDFGKYEYAGGTITSMNYTRQMSFEELPKKIKEIVAELHKRAEHLMKIPLRELNRVGVPTELLVFRHKDVETLANGGRTEPFKLNHKKKDLTASFQMVKDKDGVPKLTAYQESKLLDKLINDIKPSKVDLEQPMAARKYKPRQVLDISR